MSRLKTSRSLTCLPRSKSPIQQTSVHNDHPRPVEPLSRQPSSQSKASKRSILRWPWWLKPFRRRSDGDWVLVSPRRASENSENKSFNPLSRTPTTDRTLVENLNTGSLPLRLGRTDGPENEERQDISDSPVDSYNIPGKSREDNEATVHRLQEQHVQFAATSSTEKQHEEAMQQKNAELAVLQKRLEDMQKTFMEMEQRLRHAEMLVNKAKSSEETSDSVADGFTPNLSRSVTLRLDTMLSEPTSDDRTTPVRYEVKDDPTPTIPQFDSNEFDQNDIYNSPSTMNPKHGRRRSWQSDLRSSPGANSELLLDTLFDASIDEDDADLYLGCIDERFEPISSDKYVTDVLDGTGGDNTQIFEKRKRDLAPVLDLSPSMEPSQITTFESLLDPELASRSLGDSICHWLLQIFTSSWFQLYQFILFSEARLAFDDFVSSVGYIHLDSLICANWFCDNIVTASHRPSSSAKRSIHPSVSSASGDVPLVYQQIYTSGSDDDDKYVVYHQLRHTLDGSASILQSSDVIEPVQSNRSWKRRSSSSNASTTDAIVPARRTGTFDSGFVSTFSATSVKVPLS